MPEIIMPKMGDAMTEGKVVRWYKAEGDAVAKGEPVLEIETDKVNLDLEAEVTGVLESIEVASGDTVEVGTVLGYVGDGSAVGKKRGAAGKGGPFVKASIEPAASARLANGGQGAPRPTPFAQEGSTADFIRSSPLARKIADDLGVELGKVDGTGPRGRVVAADVRKYAHSADSGTGLTAPIVEPPKGLETREVPLTAMRRTIARRLSESIGPVPHFFLTVDLDVTGLLSLRSQLNDIQPVKTSVNDFVVRAAALSLLGHPLVNASFGENAIHLHGEVNIGVAVATPEGLITPVVRRADTRNVPQIAQEVRDLAERARNRKLKPDEYQGSTFTISNLGMFGIEEFTAIINPPNVAILAVGAAEERAVVIGGNVEVRSRMRVTMSCDHRVVDGAAGAAFLRTFRGYIEQPLRLVV